HAHRSGGNRVGDKFLGVRVATHHSTNPSDELSSRVRFRHVIIGAELQSDDLVNFPIFGGQHDHRYLRFLPDLADDIGTWLPREHQIQEHQISAITIEFFYGF